MATFYYKSDRLDILDDLLEDFRESVDVSEQSILELESDPGNVPLLRQLFRSVHTTKGNLAIVGLSPMVDVVQALEDVLDQVRQQEIPFTALVGDLTLLLLDEVKGFIQNCYQSQQAEWDAPLIEKLTGLITRLPGAKPDERDSLLKQATRLLDPTVIIDEPEKPVDDSWMTILQDDDLSFLFELAKLSEHRARFWNGRTERLIRLMLEYNRCATPGIADEELVAAILAHDIAMAFTPLAIINKEGRLNPLETERIRHHINVATGLLEHLHRFEEGKTILEQHHEFVNGEGYPNGLTDGEISSGAKMLAIVHAFESISHGQTAFTQTRRPMARAILELSSNTGTQFSERWMAPFQQVLQQSWLGE